MSELVCLELSVVLWVVACADPGRRSAIRCFLRGYLATARDQTSC